MHGRSNVIIRGYDLFILKGLEESPFYKFLNVNKTDIDSYLFFAFDCDDNVIVSRTFAEDVFTIFMHMPLITRVDTYTVSIADIHELFKRYIDIGDFEVIGRIVENIVLHLDEDNIFKEFHYSQGWFIFSVDAKKYYKALVADEKMQVEKDIYIFKGMELLDGRKKIYRKCDEVEQDAKISFAEKFLENGRFKEVQGFKLGRTADFAYYTEPVK